MMRETTFRGKSIVTGEWLYGSLINNVFFQSDDGTPVPYILDTNKIEYDDFLDIWEQMDDLQVDLETVGQFTGLHDKHGKDIYEGDVIIHDFMVYADHGNVDEESEKEVVGDITNLPFDGSSIGCEVIGNIYENYDLLEADKNDQENPAANR